MLPSLPFLLFISLFLLYIIHFIIFGSLLLFIILLGMDPKCLLTSTDLQTRRARCQHQLSFLYTLDTPTPLVAGYDLIRAAKLVIDTVQNCIWTYWFHDTLQTPTQESVPESTHSVHTLAAPPPTAWIRPVDHWLDDCFTLVGIDTATVGSIRNKEHADAKPSSYSSISGPSALVSSPGPSALVSSPSPSALASFLGPRAPVVCSGPRAPVSHQGPRAPVVCSDPRAPVSYQGPCAPVLCSGPCAPTSYQGP